MPDSALSVFDLCVSRLAAAGISSPRLETRSLLAYILECDTAAVSPWAVRLNPEQQQKLERLLAEREAHKPLCKIIGRKAFYKSEFLVSEAVLSPRPDTEILVEAAISLGRHMTAPTVLDLGTGSGCILLSILADLPKASGAGVDCSLPALKIALNNAQNLGLAKRSRFLCGSWFDSNFVSGLEKFDLIVSNPPYIPAAEIQGLEPEVRDYDPLSALEGGEDGFLDYRQLARITPPLLKKGGYILLEAGSGQAKQIAAVFSAAGLQLTEIIPDLSGKERCVILKK